MRSVEGTVRLGARIIERATANFVTYIKAVGLDALGVTSPIQDDQGNATAATETVALTTGDKM